MNLHRTAVPKTITEESASTLSRSLSLALADETVRVIILHGEEGIFCHGLDFGLGEKEQEETAEVFADLLRRFLFLPKPIIAEVSGEARGGGVGLAAACDAIVASRRASFGLPEALFGLIPAIITPVLLRRITPQKLRFLSLSCHAVDADLARDMGLVDIVVEEGELRGAVERLSRQFRRPDRDAVPFLKEFVESSLYRPAQEVLREGVTLTQTRLREQRVRTAIRDFLSEGANPRRESVTESHLPKKKGELGNEKR